LIVAGRPRRLVARFPERRTFGLAARPFARRTFTWALAGSLLLHLLALSLWRMPPPGPASPTGPLNLLLITVPRWSPPQPLELPAAAPAPAPQPLGTLPAAPPSRAQSASAEPQAPQRRGHSISIAPAAAAPQLASRLADAGAYLDPGQLSRYPQLDAPLEARYPRRAMEEGRKGVIGLQLMIDERGVVREAQVVSGDRSGEFAEAALVAARSARFLPAEAGGRPVKARAYFSVYFVIE
jgi:TonB family protein